MKGALLIVCCLLMISLFSSCGRIDKLNELKVYNKIYTINDSLDKMTREWHNLVFQAAADKNYNNLSAYRLKLGKFLSRNRELVSNLDAEGSGLIDSEITFLSNRANAVSNLYPQFELFNDKTPDDLVRKQLKGLPADLESELSGSIAMKKSLRAFAIKNALTVSK